MEEIKTDSCIYMYYTGQMHIHRWPAMIEEDPIKETYYEMGYRDTHIPVSEI